jgi:hypothetical protein
MGLGPRAPPPPWLTGRNSADADADADKDEDDDEEDEADGADADGEAPSEDFEPRGRYARWRSPLRFSADDFDCAREAPAPVRW